MATITADDIAEARRRIAPQAPPTPLVYADQLSADLGHAVWLKLETVLPTGSFKIRGATNAMLSLDENARKHGVITASSGNHGPALARAATQLGARCVVCLSRLVPENKISNVRRHGGEPHIAGRDYEEAVAECEKLSKRDGLRIVHAFDDPAIIAGAGVVGDEVVAQLAAVDTVLAPVSGGGLLAGIATAVKEHAPQARVIGVSMERGASMYESIRAAAPVDVQEVETIADALGGNIGLKNRWTFGIVRDRTDECVTVSEDQIAAAMRALFRDQGLVVEGAGAVGVAALMSGAVRISGPTVCVISGRNIEPDQFLRIVSS